MTPRHFIANSQARLRSVAQAIVALTASKEHPIEVVVRAPRKEKTSTQRGLWHALISEMASVVGYTPAEMKEVLKREYYGTETVRLPSGHQYEVVPSSENEDRSGYGRLIDFTERFAAEHGIVLNAKRSAKM